MHWSSQIRNVQLEKEARELRAENATLQQAAEQAAHAAVSNEKVGADSAAVISCNSALAHVLLSRSAMSSVNCLTLFRVRALRIRHA